MTVSELIAEAQGRDIRLWGEGDRLRYSSPKGALDEGLAALLKARKAEILAFLRGDRLTKMTDGPAPLSLGQQRLWLLDRLDPGNGAYNVPAALRLRGDLNLEALRQSIQEIVRRHEILRTRFPSHADQASQAVDPPSRVELPVEEVEFGDHVLRQRIGDEARRPFDLECGPLFRPFLFRVAPDQHVLLVTMHHIVSDGWSIGVLVGELSALYAAFAEGRPSPLPELEIQYGDFAQWQRQRLDPQTITKSVSFWQQALEGVPALDLPSDRPRPARKTYAGSQVHFVVPEDLAAGLREFSRSRHGTLFTTLLAAFEVLLARYSGQTNFAVGTPIANRNRLELEALVGFFVNALALRADLSGDPSFTELLAQVRETCVEAYAHQDLPFEKLVEELRVARDPSRTPLFQVMFALQNAPAEELKLPGLVLESIPVESDAAKFDLAMLLNESGGDLHGIVEFNTDLFDRGTIERLAANFSTLLNGIVLCPETRVSALPLLHFAELRRVLGNFNQTGYDFATEDLIHRRFEEQVRLRPASPALADGSESLDYSDLNRRAGRLANRLRAAGVTAESRVAICLERSIDMVVSQLAVLKAGGAYVPVDPSYPVDRIAFMLEDSGACVAVTRSGGVSAFQGRVISLDEEAEHIASLPAECPPSPLTDGNLAYVIYTSGSTGRPRGVAVTHRSAINLCCWHQSQFDVSSASRATLLAGVGFDASVWETWPYLTAGAALHVVPPDVVLDPGALIGLLDSAAITHSFIPTPIAERLLSSSWPSTVALRFLLTGGDRLSKHPPAGLAFEVVNNYGPTESTVVSTSIALQPGGQSSLSPSIGRPILNCVAYVLDAALRPVPIGVTGELFVGGAGIARGYIGHAAWTADRFYPDPFSGTPGVRMYRTGDLARWRADGCLEFLGRSDSQVKIRGFRIEPGEVELALLNCAGVRAAAVIARHEAPADPRLVAYLVRAQGAGPRLEDLRELLRKHLPDYMIPSGFVWMDELPLTPNGKVDRAALPPFEAERAVAVTHAAPQTATQEVLAGIWAELLGLASVGIDDDFFALGGHSLLATQVVSRVREAFQADLPLRALFEDATIVRLAARIEASAARPASVRPLVPIPRDRDLELSFAQQRLWFLEQIAPGSSLYAMPVLLRLDGRLEPDALAYAMEKLIARHEVLRTTFTSRDGVARQEIQPASNWRIPTRDLTRLPADAALPEATRIAMAQAREPFDLASGPLLRTTLFRLSESENLLLIVMHHIISDGWSIGVMVREVAELYAAFLEERRPELAELAVQYADFAHWQRQYLRGETLQADLGYWREQLRDAPVLALPTDFPRPLEQSYRGAVYLKLLPQSLVQQVRSVSRHQDVTLFMTLVAAFQVLLMNYGRQAAITIGSAIANRNHAGIEPLIGFFVNMLVLRTDLSGNPSFAGLLKRVREVTLGAFAHQDLPFEALVEALGVPRDPGHTPLFQVAFTLQNAPIEELRLPGISVSLLPAETETAKFDLSVEASENSEGLVTRWEYNVDLFRSETIVRMAECFRVVLEAVAANPEARLSEVPLLDAPEESRILLASQGTIAPFEGSVPIHRQFELHAEREPEAVALDCAGERVTYGELNARANRVAHYLRARDVRPEQCVAVCLARSIEMAVGLLGVLKAGAAYLPLDPSQPGKRLLYMVKDADARIVLTSSMYVEMLASTPAELICLNRDAVAIQSQLATNFSFETHAESPAYLIFTSGSTGQPKGVVVSHASLSHLCSWHNRTFAVDENCRATQLAGLSFDASVWELWPYLAAGASVTLVPQEVVSSPESLIEFLAAEKITHTFIPTPLVEVLLTARWPEDIALRIMLTGGNRLSRGPASALPFQLVNNYGPTEAAVVSTSGAVRPDSDEVPSIGKPIDNFRTYVLDPYLRPVPFGVPGEIYVSGPGVARGYFNRPALTAERFLPDPFSLQPSARMYRTGDLAILRDSGELHFLGRVDQQVKIRGHRIEPAEIENALSSCPLVSQSVVVDRDDGGNKRLVAYVVVDVSRAADEGASASLADDHLADWRALYEDTYSETPADRSFNPIGWNSSYTDAPIPLEEMREWRDRTLERIRSLRPRRVLEIGCGTGLLLLQLSPDCSSYIGTDFSEQALDSIRPELERRGLLHVTLERRLADDLGGLEAGSIDTVILNSVSQYFPDLSYLRTVLSSSAAAVSDGGTLFIGDVRSLTLLDAFHNSVALHRARPDLPASELRDQARRSLLNERELVIHPEFFRRLGDHVPGVSHAEIWIKRGANHDEMTLYRYDVVAFTGTVPEAVRVGVSFEWRCPEHTLDDLSQWLHAATTDAVEIRGIPNVRVYADVIASHRSQAADTFARELTRFASEAATQAGAIEPEQLWEIGERLGFAVRVSPSHAGDPALVDALFERMDASLDARVRPWVPSHSATRPGRFANNPLRTRQERRFASVLRSRLEDLLPDYMVPAAFVFLDAIPLTPNGKVDRIALPVPDSSRPLGAASFVGARTAIEHTIADIWRQVLGVDQVGMDDNFFALGGDSILSIQVVSRAARAGLKLTPKQIFEHQTVAELSKVACQSETVESTLELVTGESPLTPIQHWFFEQEFRDPHHFNQFLLLRVAPFVGRTPLAQAIEAVQSRHDALRTRFHTVDGEWRQVCGDPRHIAPMEVIDLSNSHDDWASALETEATRFQTSLSFEEGPVFRAAWIGLPPPEGSRLLMVAHHLVVDGVSWRIVVDDLTSAISQLQRKESIDLCPKTTPFPVWAAGLTRLVASGKFDAELPFWANAAAGNPQIPIDGPGCDNTVDSSCTNSTFLDATTTHALLHKASAAYRTEINDLLLAALTRVLCQWTGGSAIRIDLEGHGREEVLPEAGISHTCGWFTSVFPVTLEIRGCEETGSLVKSVKEQLRAIPQHGIGFGALRYLHPSPEIRNRLREIAPSTVSFNYLGQFTQLLAGDGPFQFAEESAGPAQSPGALRSYMLTVNSLVAGGRLRIDWIYSRDRHFGGTIKSLSAAYLAELTRLVAHCVSPEAGSYTPSDFPLARLDQMTLDRLTAGARDVEAIFPLSPLQQGLLFHSLHAAAPEMYFQQLSFEVRGEIDRTAVEQAWRHLMKMHSALRAAMLWEDLDRALQWVRRDTVLPFEYLDWRQLPPDRERDSLAAFMEKDRRRGFQMDQAPLMRIALVSFAGMRHRLIWSFHHILMDGWSLPIVLRDFLHVYDAYTRRRPLPATPAFGYRDFIAWLGRQDRSEWEAFWRAYLNGFHRLTSLPRDREVRQAASRHDERRIELPPELTARLRRFTQEHGVTLNTVVQAAWGTLLARYARTDDVVFGVAVSGRPPELPGVEQTVGLFINMLPLRLRIDSRQNVLSFLRECQSQQTEMRRFESTPLVAVQGWSEVPRGEALFECILGFESYPLDSSLRKGNLPFAVDGFEFFERTHYPLTVTVSPRDSIGVRINYDTGHFDGTAVESMLSHFGNVLDRVVVGAAGRLGDLSLVSGAERDVLIALSAGSVSDGPPVQRVDTAFEWQAARTPDAIAVETNSEVLTYAQLNARANRLARRLLALGAGSEKRVAICLERSIGFVVAALAALKAGAAYLPLDPNYPPERLRFMLEDSEASVWITDSAARSAAVPSETRLLVLDAEATSIAELPESDLAVPKDALNTAYLIYTSGSTGLPKGVEVSHASLMNLCDWHQRAFRVNPESRATQLAGLSFDASVWEIWPYLTAGARVVLVAGDTLSTPQSLVEFLARCKISQCFVPTPLAELLLECDWPRDMALRTLLTGGDLLKRNVPPGLPFDVVNNYGPTEATVVSTSGVLSPDSLGTPSIGRPIQNVRTYLLDERLEPVPAGVPGELFIGGSSPARGYWKRAGLTAERFLPDPFSPGGRMYRTGDLARRRGDGDIEFLGRIDRQVKVRGFRIELGEVEAVLGNHPAVLHAVAGLRQTASGDSALVAWIVPKDVSHESVSSELRRHLSAHLPSCMVPAIFSILDALPLNANGKVDRAALPLPAADLAARPGPVSPRDVLEEVLVALWSELLGTSAVGVEDNFFELGGHSLVATQLVSRVRSVFRTSLSLPEFFEASNISGMAAILRSRETAPGQAERVAQAWKKIRSMSAEERERLLAQKRTQRTTA